MLTETWLVPTCLFFYPDKNDCFFIHMIRGVTEQFDKYENDVNNKLWFSHLPDIDPDEHNSDFD